MLNFLGSPNSKILVAVNVIPDTTCIILQARKSQLFFVPPDFMPEVDRGIYLGSGGTVKLRK